MAIGLLSLVSVNLILLSLPMVFQRYFETLSELQEANIQELNTQEEVPQESHVQKVSQQIWLYASITVCVLILRFVWRRCLIIPAFIMKRDIRMKMLNKLLDLDLRYYIKNKAGEQINLISRDTKQLTEAISWGTIALADGIFSIASIYFILIVFYGHISWIALLVYPLLSILVIIIWPLVFSLYEKVNRLTGDITELTREMFEHIATIKSQSSEDYCANTFLDLGKKIVHAQLKISTFQSMFWPVVVLITSLGKISVIFLTIWQIGQGNASIYQFIAVINYLIQLDFPFIGLSFALNAQQKGLVNAKRIRTMLDAKNSLTSTIESTRAFPSTHLSLNVRALTFSYPDTPHFTLKINALNIPQNSLIGITGKIGSGKSTLGKLLARLIDPDTGHIFLNEHPISHYSIKELRSHITFIPQDFQLFSYSISQNMLLLESTLKPPDYETVYDLSKKSHLTQDIQAFPHRWDTLIGEHGVMLSGGQRQRTAYARSLTLDPEVLILDDVFSALDYHTGISIFTQLIHMRKNLSTVLITHNIPLFKNFDHIIVLDNGTIVGEGSHQHLLNNNTYYQECLKEYKELYEHTK